MSRTLLTVPEIASQLRVPVPRAYELARNGTLPGVVRIGRQVRIDPQKLEEFIREGGKSLAEVTRQAAA